MPAGRVATDAADAVAAADRARLAGGAEAFRARHLQHKSDLGALILNVNEEDGGPRSVHANSAALPLAEGADVLVERMAPPGVELLVAAHTDGVVPALVIALGGIWTETLDDVAVVPLPAAAERVEAGDRAAYAGAPF